MQARMNVLVLRSDEHNPLYSSAYGHPTVQTPVMARLAERGTLFESAYCPSPLCMPSRSSYMSGKRVHEIQSYNNCNVFQHDYPAYGRSLREQGVHSAHVGKTHVYNKGSALGFSDMILPGDSPPPCDPNVSRQPLQIRAGAHTRASMYGVKGDKPFARDDQRMGAALAWIREKATTLEGPWSLEVNLSNPHFPQLVTRELWEMYPDGGDLPAHGIECQSAQHPYAQDLRAHFETDLFTEEQVRGLRRGYLGCVTYVDQQLARLLTALEETGQMADTLVAYTADHGEMLGKFGMWWKCSLYEDSARIPMIIMGAGFQAGARVSTPVDAHDLRATIFRATGSEQPAVWLGTPLQDILPDDPERVVFAEYHGHGTRASAYMVRRGRWKLIWYAAGPNQLFDLAHDPNELHNVVGERADIAAELEGELRRTCSPELENDRAEEFIRRQIIAIDEMTDIPPRRIP